MAEAQNIETEAPETTGTETEAPVGAPESIGLPKVGYPKWSL